MYIYTLAADKSNNWRHPRNGLLFFYFFFKPRACGLYMLNTIYYLLYSVVISMMIPSASLTQLYKALSYGLLFFSFIFFLYYYFFFFLAVGWVISDFGWYHAYVIVPIRIRIYVYMTHEPSCRWGITL